MKLKDISKNGFTLLEIMIAMTVFSMFVTAYVVSQGNNLADSSNMRFEYKLKNILEKEINEIVIDPPEFAPGLLITTENDYRTVEGFEDYEKKVEWFEFELPDLSQLNQSEEGDATTNNANETIQSKIMTSVGANLKQLIWQLKVSIRHKETQAEMEATKWLINSKATVKFEGF